MRTHTHIIDTKAIKKIFRTFPDHWVVRELSERDYGTDLMIEIFYESGNDKNGHKIYESSGSVCNIQVKGTQEPLKICEEDSSVHYQFSKKALLYVERFATPFLLVRVDVSTDDTETYFVWLQRYIKEVLDLEYPNWRDEKQESFTLKIPIENSLKNNQKKVEFIASRIKYVEDLIEYREIYSDIHPKLIAIAIGNYSIDVEAYQYIKNQVAKISRLSTLLSMNDSCISYSSIEDLLKFIIEVENGTRIPQELLDYPHSFNLNLLSSSVDFIQSVENFVADNNDEKVY
ncbi:DUF4365 domain-containing protein [Aliarcobacter butzleri]|uniref:DUF4365 domain-containing protein n=1 Tax=Aliarcobacter butzleri TaxID=28197 RepID=UPI00263F2E49|nr:DUF4365 domain-containing protein [Aliarcobacter butzleri]MDN5060008.1 DUF4365 domain-containing protein [Aliarcobacter butzleri]